MAYGFRAKTDWLRDPRDRAGWRKLGVFWLTVLLVMSIGGGVVEFLGPPSLGPPVVVALAPLPVVAQVAVIAPRLMVGRDVPGPIASPDPALMEPANAGSTEHLPRIAPDGRAPMRFYAAGFDPASRLPRIGILLAGIGLNEAESEAAIQTLPGAVSLAVSPYAVRPAKLLAAARASGHEYLLAIPLEPVGFPLNDPGPATLLTSASEAVNAANLNWALARIDGYAGVTGVIGTMRGERLAGMTDQMDAVLASLSGRGLFYVDPREGRGPIAKAWGRHAELVIDEAPDRASIDAKLSELEQQAKDHGSALGLAMRPTPVAVARIAAWTNGLTDRGLVLAPASALAVAPAGMPVKLTERDH
jgi:polysaccharide deacetylase 2 family uncharacterized protein YibQ